MKHLKSLSLERSAIRWLLGFVAALHLMIRVIMFMQQPDMGGAALILAAIITLLGLLLA